MSLTNITNITVISLIIISLISLTYSSESECTSNLIYSQDCSWYLRCLQQKYHCGSKGYPVGFGYKYCQKFYQLQQKAIPIVKQWIQNILVCLKHSLIKYVDQSQSFYQYQKDRVCHMIKKDAFASHPICYTKSGFCQIWKQLGVKESAKFIKELVQIFEIKDFIEYQAIKQIFSTINICVQKKI